MKGKSILIAGVGGQGALLAAHLLGNAALKAGFEVKVSEVHGMAQRGGSVVTYVKYGDKVFSPVINRGEADIIIALEQMEALRWSHYLKPDGTIIMSTRILPPMPVLTGDAIYNEGIIAKLSAVARVEAIDAEEIARQCGNQKASNTVLIGALSKHITADGIENDLIEQTIAEYFSAKTAAINLAAFKAGSCV